jgi:hypothetical protein
VYQKVGEDQYLEYTGTMPSEQGTPNQPIATPTPPQQPTEQPVLVTGNDGKTYQQVGEDQYVEYTGTLPPEQQQVSNAPTTGEIAGGLGAEIGISTAGQAIAPFTGVLAPLVAFGSGAYGSYVAQQIEGREDVSLGRIFSAGVINLIPGAKLTKVNAATDITKELVKEAAKVEAKRGAVFGVGEATAISVIDEQRLPTPTELLQYGAGGAVFGGAIGAASPKIAKSFSKFLGKTPTEIDISVANGTINADDILRTNITDSSTEARQIIDETIANISNKQVIKTLTNAVEANNNSPFERTKAWLTPSRVTGQEVQDIAFYGNAETKANTELASKIGDRVSRFIDKTPSVSDDVNAYLDNPIDMPVSLKGTAIEGDLVTYRDTLKNLQKTLVSQLSDQKFSSLAAQDQKALLNTIQQSLTETNPNYVTREYEAFTNVDWTPDPVLKQEAIKELAARYRSAEPKLPLKDAVNRASDHINNIIKDSAKNKQLSNKGTTFGSADSVLRAKGNPGKAERAFLGEVVDPAERMRGTLDNVGRVVYKNKADIAVANALQKVGLAFKSAPDDAAFTQLTLKGNLETGLYVPNNVQYALDNTYLSGYQERGANILKEGIDDLYRASIGLSKAVKVILNPPSYLVNAYGGMATILGSGINPISVKYGTGLKYALAEYGAVDRILAGNNAEARTALNEAMFDMTKYGISNANVIASDIRSTFDRGFFSESLSKAFEPVSKAYQATDTAARFTVWATNQERLSNMFPTLNREEVKLAAAKLTNDTYQNYDKLNESIRVLSRYGVLNQFVSFTAELMRNIYNQVRYATQMTKGTFGADIGITASESNKVAMRLEGVKRLTALSVVIAGTEAARQAHNASNGVDEEMEKALKETVVADYDKSKSLLFTKDEKTGEFTYANLSYIVPHAMLAEVFNAATNDQPLETIGGILVENFIGEGSFVANSAIKAISNVDANGNKISVAQDEMQKFKEQLNYFISDAFKPGVAREAEKVIEAATKEDPTYNFKEIAQRQLGYRIRKVNVDGSTFKVRDASDNAKQASSKYTSLLRYKDPTPVQAKEAYEEANELRKQNMEVVSQHYSNLVKLGVEEEERVKIMKRAGVSSKDILATMEGVYLPLDPELQQSTADIYEERYQGLAPKEAVKDIKARYKEDPILGKKLYNTAIERFKEEKSNTSERVKLIKNLGTADKVAYIIANPDMLNELKQNRVLTKAVLQELSRTPEGKAVLNKR